MTNNSGYTPRELNQKLARMGLDVPEEHFYTSALATAAFLKEQAAGCSAFVIGEAGLLNALYDVGITMNEFHRKNSDSVLYFFFIRNRRQRHPAGRSGRNRRLAGW